METPGRGPVCHVLILQTFSRVLIVSLHSPVEVTNNVIAGEVTFKFSSATMTEECVFSDTFATDTDLVVGLFPDSEAGDDDDVIISSITVAS